MSSVREVRKLRYRRDVDGLRAVAVLLVLADHLNVFFHGGYVGVDVFFVISGYLITATILPEVMEDRFSLVGFYERRVRRIFPAMLAMFAVTTVLSYFFLVPHELEAYSRSLLAALFSASNFLFWHEAGYFNAASSSKPLLHTWSLAVEEQFYLFFPLYLVFVARHFAKRMRLIVVATALVSFVGAVLTVPGHAAAAFFFAPLRAWELLLGSMLTLGPLPERRARWVREVEMFVAILLIVVPARLFDGGTSFPGLAALPACLGATLIIAEGESGGSLVGRLLSSRPMVGIGLISYSLYLWHWPIIVFARVAFFRETNIHGAGLRWAIVLASLSLAAGFLSWAFIEQPLRVRGRFRPGRAMLFAMSGVLVLVLAGVGVGLLVAHGVPSRYTLEEQRFAAYDGLDENGPFRGGRCFIGPDFEIEDFDRQLCLERHAGRAAIAVVGDSHAAALWVGMAKVYPDRDVLQATIAGCRPLLHQLPRTRPDCTRMYDYLFQDYLLNDPVQAVILEGRWQPEEIAPLGETVAYLKAHNVGVTVMGPMIEYDAPLPRLIAEGMHRGYPQTAAEHRMPAPERMDREMAGLARTSWHVPYISVYQDLCVPDCPVAVAPGVPLLFDTDHLTEAGSVRLAEVIRRKGEIW